VFSSRLDWSLTPNRLTRALQARRAAGAEILDLTESNPTHAGIEYPGRDVLQAFADTRALVYDPSPMGHPEARAAVSRYYAERGVDVDAGRVLLTASSSESYGFLFKLLCDPGDEVLVPRPSYPLFEFLGDLESIRVRHYGLSYHGRWVLDVADVAEAVTPRTRALIVVNPNNPTGSFLKRDELDALAGLARERKFALIADEVFSDFAFGDDPARVSTVAAFYGAPAFALSGLSKVAGLPQMKLGWMILAGPPDFQGAARNRLELIADTYLSVSTPVQHAAPRLIEIGLSVRDRIAARTRANLARLQTLLHPVPAAEILDVEGGWYAIVRVPRTRSEEEWTLELLESDGVLVQPGFFYDFEAEAFLVVSLLTNAEVFEEGVGRLAARIAHA
jgi:alanine-synthesizing transaminase